MMTTETRDDGGSDLSGTLRIWLSARWTVPALVWLAFLLTYAPLRLSVGESARAITVAAAVVTAWYGGAAWGAVAGFAAVPVAAMLYQLAISGSLLPDVWLTADVVAGLLAAMLAGFAVGYTRDLNRRVAAGAAQRARAERELRERDERLAGVNEIARAIRNRASARHLIKAAVAALHRCFPSLRAAYSTVDEAGRITIVSALGPDELTGPDDTLTALTLPVDCLEPLKSRHLVVVDDVERIVEVAGLAAALAGGNARTFLDAPVHHAETQVGLLSLESATPHTWTGHERAMVQEMADFLAVALADAHTKQQLAESEQQFRTLASDSGAGIALLRGRDLIYVNPAIEAIGGYTLAELAETNFLDVVHPDFRSQVTEWIETRLRGQPVTPRFEMKILTKDGATRWLDVRTSDIALSGTPALLTTVLDITDRKLAEDTIRESELKFRTVAESSHAMIALMQKQGAIYLNPALERISEYTRDELMQLELWDLLHPDDRSMIRNYRGRRLHGKEAPQSYEVRLITKSGAVRWLDVRASVFDLAGEPTILTTGVDVTKRKTSEEAVRAGEVRLRVLLDHYFDGVAVVEHRMLSYVNPTVCRMFGYRAEEMIGQDPLTLTVAPHHHGRARRRLQDLDAGAPEYPSEYEGRRKDGSTFPLEVAARRIELEGRPALLCTLRDLTARHQAEAEIRASEQRFRSLFEQAPIGIVLADADTRVLQVNGVFCDMLGYTKDELIGRSFVDVTHPDDAGGSPASAHKVLVDAESTLRLQKRYLRKNGDPVEAETTVSLARDDAGRLLYAMAMIEDVTEKRALEDQLRQTQRLESVGQLAGGVAHNFNNALTAIIGYSELLGRRLHGEDAGLKDIEQIQRVAERSASLTRQLLTFSREEVTRPSVFCLNAVAEATSTLLSPLIGNHIRLRLRLDRTLKDIRADRSQMEQVVTNLMLNARDAMPDGGVVTIETQCVDIDDTTARTHPDAQLGPYIRLSVTDTGIGMDAMTAGRIFEPFFTTKEPGEGVGLGLAMVHGAVKQTGGFITVRSKPGGGTTLMLHVPVHDASPAEAPAAVDRPIAQ